MGIVVLGATGSIGVQTLETIEFLKEKKEFEHELWGISCHKNIALFIEQIKRYQPKFAVITEEKNADILKKQLKNYPTIVLSGKEGIEELLAKTEVTTVVNGITGIAGLQPSLLALENNKILALANKESLVTGGPLIKSLLEEKANQIIPVDSEHSAIFQLLQNEDRNHLDRIILTASGGPFHKTCKEEFKKITPDMALKHPNWSMGKKISIDSATLMNKALEVIEAHWLFDLDYDRIEVLIHPESIIHSMIQLKDRSILAHMGVPDMRGPIQYALTYPRRKHCKIAELDLTSQGQLTFAKPRFEDFPALRIGYEAGKAGGTMPVVLNGANEVLVSLFLEGKISFTDIAVILERILKRHKKKIIKTLDDVLYADSWARDQIQMEVE